MRWLARVLKDNDRFRFPPLPRGLPECLVRPCEPADRNACAEIYRLNEPGRFPPGNFDHFVEWLASGQHLFIVAEVNGVVRGFGGIGAVGARNQEDAYLSYGMVR